VLLALTIGRNPAAVTANFGTNWFAGSPQWSSLFVITFGSALVGSLFSADSWHSPTFAAAEVQNPQKNLPRALLLGTVLVSALYILANLGYLSVLPLHGAADGATVIARGIDHATNDRVATAVMEYIFGANGAAIMAGAILISTFGCNNGLILSGARVYYAMARDGLFFQKAGVLSKNSVPAFALIAQSVWTSLLCLTGTYNQLLDYVIFAALLFYALTTIGLFILRVKRPDEPRPYRAVGYPVLPALYILFASGIAITLLVADKTRVQALSGLALVVLGVPVYHLWQRGGKSPAAG
jgi:APA family basic amino acid/polyamine antiporter